jgi:hypothetical protein
MPCKTKRQQQVSKLLRKKGRYVSQDQVILEETDTEENDIIEEWIESEEWPDDGIIGWTGEELKEFDKVGKRLITEALHWYEGADHNIRAVYTGNSRTTVWRKGKEKQKLESETKGMKTLDTFFKSSETLYSPRSSQSRSSPSQSPSRSSSSLFSEIIKSPLFSIDNLRTRLKEINQQCIISKSAKDNKKIFTYNYLRCLSICRFIQLLLDGEGKMNASNNIAQIVWNKGDYIARCIRKWKTYFLRTGELLVYHQGRHTKLESLVDDEDFKEECLIWLRQQAPESRFPRNLKIYIEETVFPKLTGHITHQKKHNLRKNLSKLYA